MIYALWHGGSSYAVSDPEQDLERFASMRDAVIALESRRNGHHWRQSFDYVSREPENVFTPVVDETSEMHVFMSDPRKRESPDAFYPDKILSFGPETGAVLETST